MTISYTVLSIEQRYVFWTSWLVLYVSYKYFLRRAFGW